jgi:hypothetical protein
VSIRRNLVASMALFVVLGGTSYAAVGAAAAPAGRRGHRSASSGCYPKGSTTIVQDTAGRFYFGPSGPHRRGWYVCVFKQGTPRKLRYPGGGGSPFVMDRHTATVSGRYLAFVFLGDAPRCCGVVVVIDMATGQRTFTGAFNARTTIGDFGPFPSMPPVLKSDGSVAWIYTADGSAEVHRHDSTGTAIVDSGPQINPYSLAAGGSWLYWTNAGSPRSAPFH